MNLDCTVALESRADTCLHSQIGMVALWERVPVICIGYRFVLAKISQLPMLNGICSGSQSHVLVIIPYR